MVYDIKLRKLSFTFLNVDPIVQILNLVLEKTLESPLDSKEIKPVNPTGNQPWMFIRRTDAEAEGPLLWPPWYEELTHWKRPDAEKDRAWGERGDRGWDGWMASSTQGTWICANSVKDREACHDAVHKVAKSWIWLSDWTRISTEIPAGRTMCCC